MNVFLRPAETVTESVSGDFFWSCVTDFWLLFSFLCHHFHFYNFMFYFEVLILMFLVSLYTSCIYPSPPHVDCSTPDSFHLLLVIHPFLLQLCTTIPIIAVFVILDFSVLLSKLRVPCCLQTDLRFFSLQPVDFSVCFA